MTSFRASWASRPIGEIIQALICMGPVGRPARGSRRGPDWPTSPTCPSEPRGGQGWHRFDIVKLAHLSARSKLLSNLDSHLDSLLLFSSPLFRFPRFHSAPVEATRWLRQQPTSTADCQPGRPQLRPICRFGRCLAQLCQLSCVYFARAERIRNLNC